MTDYSRPYRGVAYFGLWATDTADDYGRRDATAVLAGAVDICDDEDLRSNREVTAALAYLARHGHEKRVITFRKALGIPDPAQRRHALAAALAAINYDLGLAWGRVPDRF